MTQKQFYITFLLLITALWTAKPQNRIYGPLAGIGVIYEISNNGRYISGMTQTSNGEGCVWDVQAGEIVADFGLSTYPYCVTDDKMVVGIFPDNIGGVSLISAGYSTESKAWTSLGLGVLDLPENNEDGSSARRVTPDGKLIVGYSKKDIVSRKINVPYAWRKNEAGEWTGEVWAHPENTIQTYILDISDDGKTGVGFVHAGRERVAILWKSSVEYATSIVPETYSEYFCISANGKYAGFAADLNLNGIVIAGIHDIETGEIIPIPEGFRVNSVTNNGFAFGAYKNNGIDRPFVWNKKLGFMDFGDFIINYATGLNLSEASQLQAVLADKLRTLTVHAATPDGLTFAVCLPSGSSGTGYVINISPVTIYPYPRNLTADVPVADRNKVILNWDAPDLEGETLTGYAVYRGTRLLGTVDGETLTYTDLNVPAGYYNYTVKGVYEGGYSSNVSNTARAVIINNYDLPLRENFDRLNLTSNYWTTEISKEATYMGWNVYSDVGVESGTGLLFQVSGFGDMADNTYSAALISKYLDAANAEKVYLSFLTKPEYYREPGLTPDTLSIDVHDGNTWKNIDKYTFKTRMEWKAEIIDLSEAVSGKLFRLRFRITGANHTVSAKHIHFDDIVIATAPPAGDAVPQQLSGEISGTDNIRLVWQNPQTNLYALTYANSSKRGSIGNEGVSFIAANRFDADELNINAGLYLTSISAYINRKVQNPAVATVLKLAVFADGERIVNQPVSAFNPNKWNTFYLDNPVLLGDKDLVFGLEVVSHDQKEEPIGIDGAGSPVSGKGDLYSENGGQTWKTLTGENLMNNWCITGNLSSLENTEVKPSDIVGYNVYRKGIKLNDDLIFGQSFTTDNSPGAYTVRAYSLASGISAESQEWRFTVDGIPSIPPVNVQIYPNPAQDMLFIRSETPVESLSVYDLSGRICKQAGAGTTTLFVGDLTSGIYIVGIKTASGESMEKIYIKKTE
ncbi:MAG: T9SS type A sorting domain-containing protein [Dysgonamonadaceae bacterium]|jgi:hypothetical protein|nr:T9SS type A sorting domain-containing protein [Dysgonamonadaceae bacterium]